MFTILIMNIPTSLRRTERAHKKPSPFPKPLPTHCTNSGEQTKETLHHRLLPSVGRCRNPTRPHVVRALEKYYLSNFYRIPIFYLLAFGSQNYTSLRPPNYAHAHTGMLVPWAYKFRCGERVTWVRWNLLVDFPLPAQTVAGPREVKIGRHSRQHAIEVLRWYTTHLT